MYLLDTHVLFWWAVEPERLSDAQSKALDRAEAEGEPLAISAISLWELAMMAQRKRLRFPQPMDVWLQAVERDPAVRVLPLTAGIAARSVHLGGLAPQDPADCLIMSTALVHGLPLVTSDDRIRKSGIVPVV